MSKKQTEFLYGQVYDDIRSKILNGTLVPGEHLKPENVLKDEYHVSRDTMRKAMALLERDGLIVRKASAGTTVAFSKTEYEPMNYHESFSERMLRLGYKPSSEVQSIEILSELDHHIATAMDFKPGDKMYRIKRVRNANGEPMAFEITYVYQKYCPNLHTMIYDNTSLYDLYENHYNIKMGRIDMQVEAETADAQLIKLLHLHNSTALLKITSLMHLTDGSPFYYVISYHIGEKYTFCTSLPRTPKNGI